MVEALPEQFLGRIVAIIVAENLFSDKANHIRRIFLSSVEQIGVGRRDDLAGNGGKGPQGRIKTDGDDGDLRVDLLHNAFEELVLSRRMQKYSLGGV